MNAQILYATWPDEAVAQTCARVLVEEKLAACVTLLPGARSIFVWEGEIEEAAEVVMLAKTAADRTEAAKRRILDLHPYDLPCLLAWAPDLSSSNPAFIEWVWNETR